MNNSKRTPSMEAHKMNRMPFAAALTVFLAVLLASGLAVARGGAPTIDSMPQPEQFGADLEITAGYSSAARAGGVVTFAHTLRNISREPSTVTVAVGGDRAAWVLTENPQTFELGPRSSVDVRFVVAVPAGIEPGGVSSFEVSAEAQVSAGDAAQAVDTLTVLATPVGAYLPIVSARRSWAPPTLAEIANWNMDGEYVVRWRAVDHGRTYELQEARSPGFEAAARVYSGPKTAQVLSGRTSGVYYYRVRHGTGAWSKAASTVVLSSPGIYGFVHLNGTPTAGVPLKLHRIAGSAIVEASRTTSGPQGLYQFGSLPSLAAGEAYSVGFGPNEDDPTRVYLWENHYQDEYNAGDSQRGGDFDVGNVTIEAPGTSASLDPPIEFRWKRRAATPDDDYMVRILDLQSGETAWESGHLGYAENYTLASRPEGLEMGTPYGWYLVIFGAEGVGYSNGKFSYTITFPRPQVSNVDVDNQTGGSCTVQVSGYPRRTMPPGLHSYGTVSPGHHTYSASCWCGSGSWSDYFRAGYTEVITLRCTSRESRPATRLEATTAALRGSRSDGHRDLPAIPDSHAQEVAAPQVH